MVDINIGAIAEQLNYKVDLDMHNSQKPYIVETYRDGRIRFRIWSNKFFELWDYTGPRGTYTFPKEFSDTNSIRIFLQGSNNESSSWPTTDITYPFINQVTTTSCHVGWYGSNINEGFNIYISGYIL